MPCRAVPCRAVERRQSAIDEQPDPVLDCGINGGDRLGTDNGERRVGGRDWEDRQGRGGTGERSEKGGKWK